MTSLRVRFHVEAERNNVNGHVSTASLGMSDVQMQNSSMFKLVIRKVVVSYINVNFF